MADVEETPQEKALRDLGYELGKTFGIIWLAKRLGLELKAWVREREEAAES